MKYLTAQPRAYLGIGQLMLAACLLACFFITPHYFFSLDQGGVSNYGTESPTQPFFVLGFGAAAAGALAAALTLAEHIKNLRLFKYGLILLALLYCFVLLSTLPYKLSDAYEALHLAAGFSLSVYMLAAVLFIRFKRMNDRKITSAFYIYMSGFAIALMTLFGLFNLLFTAQILCGASFGYIISRCVLSPAAQ